MSESTLIISHADLDGVGCVILLRKNKNFSYQLRNYSNIDQQVVDALERHASYEKIYITDICPSEEVCEMIDKSAAKDKITLLDHHKTKKWVSKYSWAIYDDSLCGTSLVFSHADTIEDIDARAVINFSSAVEAWDLWKMEDPFRERGENLNTLLKFLGNDYFITKFSKNLNADSDEFKDTIRILNKNKKEHIRKTVKSYVPRCKIHSDGNGRCFKILVITDFISEIGNSILSSEEYKDLDYVVMADPLNNKVGLRSRKNEVDVSEIASKLGGGGHRSAAGFPKKISAKIEQSLADIFNNLVV